MVISDLNSIKIDEDKDKIKKKIDRLDSQYNTYQSSVLVLNESKNKINDYKRDINTYESEIERLENITINNLCPVTNEKCSIIGADKIKEINDEINRIKESASESNDLMTKEEEKYSVLSDAIKKIEKELLDYSELQDKYNEIQLKENNRERLIEYIDKTKVKLGKKEEELNDIKDNTQHYDEARLRFVEDECIKLRDTLSRLDERYSQIELQRASEYNNILEIEGQLERLQEYRKEYKENEVILERIKKIRDIFKEVGSRLVENYLNNISYDANEIWQELMNSNNTLTWESDYNIKIGNLDFLQLSGAQKVISSISVRLALSKYLSDIRILILDEPSANLDLERRENMVESIRQLSGYSQIIVVSHDSCFENITDNIIELN